MHVDKSIHTIQDIISLHPQLTGIIPERADYYSPDNYLSELYYHFTTDRLL